MKWINRKQQEMHYLVISADKEWSKKIFGKNKNVVIGDSENAVVDMYLTMLCKHNILANSSFATWGALLRGTGDVIYPKPWYGPIYNKFHKGLYKTFPSSWHYENNISWSYVASWIRYLIKRILMLFNLL